MNLAICESLKKFSCATIFRSSEISPLALSTILHCLILAGFLINFKHKFSPQQVVNVQLIASNNSLKSSKLNNDYGENVNKSTIKSDDKNLETIESKAIYDANYLNNPPPLYPPLAKSRNIEGKVVLEVLVSDQGEALKVKIISSSGSTLLDDSAYDAVKNWKFIPAQKFGKNVDATILIPIEFKIVN